MDAVAQRRARRCRACAAPRRSCPRPSPCPPKSRAALKNRFAHRAGQAVRMLFTPGEPLCAAGPSRAAGGRRCWAYPHLAPVPERARKAEPVLLLRGVLHFAHRRAVVDSGVEHANAAAARESILKELAALCAGPVEDGELADTKRAEKPARRRGRYAPGPGGLVFCRCACAARTRRRSRWPPRWTP